MRDHLGLMKFCGEVVGQAHDQRVVELRVVVEDRISWILAPQIARPMTIPTTGCCALILSGLYGITVLIRRGYSVQGALPDLSRT